MGNIKNVYEMSTRKPRCRWADNISTEYQRNSEWKDVLTSTGSREDPKEDFMNMETEPYKFHKSREILDQLSTYQFFYSWQGKRLFSSPLCPEWLWPTQPSMQWVPM
jgi:hypothetical protein